MEPVLVSGRGSLIATFCLRQGLALLHNDRDFDSFAEPLGLQVVDSDQST